MHLPLRFKELKRILSANIIPTLRKNKNLQKISDHQIMFFSLKVFQTSP